MGAPLVALPRLAAGIHDSLRTARSAGNRSFPIAPCRALAICFIFATIWKSKEALSPAFLPVAEEAVQQSARIAGNRIMGEECIDGNTPLTKSIGYR